MEVRDGGKGGGGGHAGGHNADFRTGVPGPKAHAEAGAPKAGPEQQPGVKHARGRPKSSKDKPKGLATGPLPASMTPPLLAERD
jgi:hypothetical protein